MPHTYTTISHSQAHCMVHRSFGGRQCLLRESYHPSFIECLMSNDGKTLAQTKTKHPREKPFSSLALLRTFRLFFQANVIARAQPRRCRRRHKLRKAHCNFVCLLSGVILPAMAMLCLDKLSVGAATDTCPRSSYTSYTLALISFTLVCYIVLPVALICFYPFFHFVAVTLTRCRSFSRPQHFSYLKFSAFYKSFLLRQRR